MSESGLESVFILALQALTEWLADHRVPYVAIGGIAVSLTAQPRATQDIDAVIWLEEPQWAAFLQAGERYGFVSRISDPLVFARRTRVLALVHQDSNVKIDLSCGALPFEQEMIERAKSLTIGKLTLCVPTPEDLIITKAIAHRPKDRIDIEAILKVHPDLDLARVRYWTQAFAEVLEMPELQETLEQLINSVVQPKSGKRQAAKRGKQKKSRKR